VIREFTTNLTFVKIPAQNGMTKIVEFLISCKYTSSYNQSRLPQFSLKNTTLLLTECMGCAEEYLP